MAEQLSIDRSKTAVIVLDYQIRMFNFFPQSFQNELAKRANEVLAKARSMDIPIIYVEAIRGERTEDLKIYPAVAPKSEEILLTKNRTGPFSSTNLNEILRKRGINTLALMGIAASGCVLTTVRWGSDIDYKLIVLSDCSPDRDSEVERVLMTKVFPKHASVITSQEFIHLMG